MTDITIPEEALQKAWEKYLLDGCGPNAFEAACQALLRAWPKTLWDYKREDGTRLILPLTQETRDE